MKTTAHPADIFAGLFWYYRYAMERHIQPWEPEVEE